MGQRLQAKGCKYKGIYGHCFGRIFAECKLAENGIQRIPQPGAEAIQQRGARDGQRTAERSRDAGAACDGQRQRGQLAPVSASPNRTRENTMTNAGAVYSSSAATDTPARAMAL